MRAGDPEGSSDSVLERALDWKTNSTPTHCVALGKFLRFCFLTSKSGITKTTSRGFGKSTAIRKLSCSDETPMDVASLPSFPISRPPPLAPRTWLDLLILEVISYDVAMTLAREVPLVWIQFHCHWSEGLRKIWRPGGVGPETKEERLSSSRPLSSFLSTTRNVGSVIIEPKQVRLGF